MRLFIISMLFLFVCQVLSGQGNRTVKATDALESLKQKEQNGQVFLSLDSLIEENYHKHLIQNSKNRGVSGYRIRIFSDNGSGAKNNQTRVRARFLSTFSDIPTYKKYEGSYFKIYVGDFRTKRDALRALKNIKREFPDAFIVEDIIVIEE